MATTVRETTYDLLRDWGLTTVFGNPGSNELPFLDGFPPDFRYVLGLHEGVVLGMADGYAQATGRPALVNLHSAAGLGNAMGNLANARVAQTPLVVTAGQQSRAMVGLGSMLGEPQMIRVPEPQVKWSFEPARAQDVPRALSEAFHLATLPPRGPVFVSLPLDDWAQPVDEQEVAHLAGRRVRWSGALTPDLLEELAGRVRAARSPVLVLGPEADDEVAYPRVVALAERLQAPVWASPSQPRCPFPTRHPLWQGVLPPSIRGVSGLLAGADLVLVLGAPVFRYHVYLPGPWLPEGAELVSIGSDPAVAARPAFGDAVVADVGTATGQLLEALAGDAERPARPAPQRPAAPEPGEAPFPAAVVFGLLARSLPEGIRFVTESTANTHDFWQQVPLDGPRRYFFPAAGGLGFGLPAAVGVALADPSRPVVAVLGDGAAQYGITGLWTAAQLGLPVTFLVLRNGGYGALRNFVDTLGVAGTPGLELPELDAVQIAAGYGVPARRIAAADELADALAGTGSRSGPLLLEVPITAERRVLG